MMIRISHRLQKGEKNTPLVKRSKVFQIFTISILTMSLLYAFVPFFNQEIKVIEDTEIIPAFPEKLSSEFIRIDPNIALPSDNTFFIYKNRNAVFNNTLNVTQASSAWNVILNNTREDNAQIDIYVDDTWFEHYEVMNSSSMTIRIPLSAGNHSLQLNTWSNQIKQYVRDYSYHYFSEGEEFEDQFTIKTANEFKGEKVVDYLFIEPTNVSQRALNERKQYVEDIIGDFANVRQTYTEMSYEKFTFRLGAVIGWIKIDLSATWINLNQDTASDLIVESLDPYYSFKDTDLIVIFYLTNNGWVATGNWRRFETSDAGESFPYRFFGRVAIPAQMGGSTHVVTHELGHTFALGHPEIQSSFAGISYSLMGYSGRQYIGFYRYALSWLDVEKIYWNETVTAKDLVALSDFTPDDTLTVLVREDETIPEYYVLEYRKSIEDPTRGTPDIVILYKINSTVFELVENNTDRFDVFIMGISVLREWARPQDHYYDEYFLVNENNQTDISLRIWWTNYTRPRVWINDRTNTTV